MFKKLSKFLLPVVVLSIAIGSFQYLKANKPERKPPQLREKVWQIETITADIQSLAPLVRLYGRVESRNLVKAGAAQKSIVTEVLARDGDKVTEGTILVELDRRDFETAVTRAEAELTNISSQLQDSDIRHQTNLLALQSEQRLLQLFLDEVSRLQQLKQNNLSSESTLNEAKRNLEKQQIAVQTRKLEVERYPATRLSIEARSKQATATLAEARLALQRSRVTAPFDGIVKQVNVSVGDQVASGQVLLEVYSPESLEIRAHLPQKYIASVQQALGAGSSINASISSQSGRVNLLRTAGESEATGIDVFFNASEQSRYGELLTLELKLPDQPGALAIPYQAIYGNSRVYRVINSRLQAVSVETLGQLRTATGEMMLLVGAENLQNGDQIVTTHLPNAVTGLLVKVDDGSA